MANIERNESVQVQTLVKIYEVLDCNIEDIVELKLIGVKTNERHKN